MKTLAELAGELYDALETDQRVDGKKFLKLRKGAPDWAQEVVRKAHGDEWPDDTIYDFINRCASAIYEAGAEDEDAAQEAVYEIEADVYTNSLTAWLNERCDHVFYLTEALEDGVQDGFQALQFAQTKQIQEIGGNLIAALLEAQSDLEDE